jgi:RNA polymerase sigma-70 factor, ECF subfamily
MSPPATMGVTPVALEGSPMNVSSIHEAHCDFVWSTLQRFGVRAADLEDMMQEVFVVVHRRLHTFDGVAQMTTWLYGICERVAADYRRRAYIRREESVEQVPDIATTAGPEDAAVARERRQRLEQILDQMDLTRRAVFVMFEIEELPCETIAAMIGVPVGTVYSRLHVARLEFKKILARSQARAGGGDAT